MSDDGTERACSDDLDRAIQYDPDSPYWYSNRGNFRLKAIAGETATELLAIFSMLPLGSVRMTRRRKRSWRVRGSSVNSGGYRSSDRDHQRRRRFGRCTALRSA